MKNVMHEKSYYGNNEVYYNDILLFYTSDRKINWYMKKGLMSKITDKKYIFLFEPKDFAKKDHVNCKPILIENKCVNCGSEKELTKHHIVPFSYRKYMPVEYKSHNSHDVLMLCFNCHAEYEKSATILKKELARQYDVPLEGIIAGYPQGYKNIVRISNILNVYGKESINLPIDKKERIKKEILEFFGYIPEGEELQNIVHNLSPSEIAKRVISHSEELINRIENLDDFVVMWRKHFIENIEGKYLPKYWNINNKKVYN